MSCTQSSDRLMKWCISTAFKMKRKVFSIVLFAFVICIVADALEICRYSALDEKRKCDVAVILGAGVSDDGVSPVYAARIDHGIRLLRDEYADYIMLTGATGEGNSMSDAAVAKEYAIEMGVSEDEIILEDKSRITQENLKNAKEIMLSRGLASCIIVSDPLHMKRAMTMAHDFGMNAYSSPTTTSRYVTWKTKLPFLLREEFFFIGYKICEVLV